MQSSWGGNYKGHICYMFVWKHNLKLVYLAEWFDAIRKILVEISCLVFGKNKYMSYSMKLNIQKVIK